MNIKTEGRIIRFGIILFWTLFWLLNVFDKFITKPTILWVGKDRLAQFIDYFASIGINNPIVASTILQLVILAEVIAFICLFIALIQFILKNHDKAQTFFFWGTLTGLIIFSFFSIGDQFFGDRHELLEHTTYWLALIISWGAYVYFPKRK
jgi:hypothetical protein